MSILTKADKEFIKKEFTEDSTKENISFLASKFEVSTRSIIAVLTAANLYKRSGYTTKAGEKPINKAEIVELIASALGIDSEQLEGLDKAPKHALRLILRGLDEESDSYFKP